MIRVEYCFWRVFQIFSGFEQMFYRVDQEVFGRHLQASSARKLILPRTLSTDRISPETGAFQAIFNATNPIVTIVHL
jgi:hypothetical protein